MAWNSNGQNAIVNGLASVITHVGLLSTALAELSGGSPAYARRTVTFGAAAGGVRASNADITPFDVSGAAEIAALGFYSALTAGTFYGYHPLGGFEVEAATVAAGTEVFTDYAHALDNGHRVFVLQVHTNGLPTGLSALVLYHVVNKTTDTFQLATTAGGLPVNVTASGKVLYQRCTPFQPPGQSTVPFVAGNITLDGRLTT